MNRLLLSGRIPWGQRIAAVLVWLIGLALVAALLVFGFFVGAALLGVTAIVVGPNGFLDKLKSFDEYIEDKDIQIQRAAIY